MNLGSPITQLPLVGPYYAGRLKNLGIETVKDLLYHIPHKYLDFSEASEVARVQVGEVVTIQGKLTEIKNIYTRFGKKFQLAKVEDKSGSISVVWFNQPFLIKILTPGQKVSLAGKIGFFGKRPAMISPEYEKLSVTGKPIHTAGLIPIYPETAGVSSKWLRAKIKLALEELKGKLIDIFPETFLDKYLLPDISLTLKLLHYPKTLSEAKLAKYRLAFEEFFLMHLHSVLRKQDWLTNEVALKLRVEKKLVNDFIENLPFTLTNSQEKSVEEILADLVNPYPMNRLLEGDVGSGKTVVSAIAAFVSFVNGYQSVFMAPTQILAQQHFNTLNSLFSAYKLRVSLVTSAGVKADIGKTDIFIGTHALIHSKVDFDKVAMVVIDEQHRFGVEQRAHLIKKSGPKRFSPHVLTMTATPIPRTIALSIYGDLDLSTLDELPKGRKKIVTWIVPSSKRQAAYAWIKDKITKERTQAFIVCPLIEQSEVETMASIKAVTTEYIRLKKLFTGLSVGLLHGKLGFKEKNEVVDKFARARLDILVTTPVVEVGIDMPNATIMVIEGAERFGLAQLHQLRGRIGRSDKRSFCLIFANGNSSGKSLTRLNALKKSQNGRELSELDLKLRGPGEVFGLKQSGFFELKAASWSDLKLITKTRQAVFDIKKDPKAFNSLLKKLKEMGISPT